MAQYELLFDNSQFGNFNTAGFTGGLTGSQSLKVNSAHPADRLVQNGAIASKNDITGWRLTVEGDEEAGDNDVVPNAPMTIEYSTDGGQTWQSYVEGIGRPDAVFYARQDEEGWMAITANVPGQADGQMGFIVADAGVTPGQVFTTDETVLEKQHGEYELPYICFSADTLIDTADGAVRAADLTVGTLVRTRDDGMQPVRWVGRRQVALADAPAKLRPIRIRAGALGAGMPAADLVVSPQHRVLVRSQIAQRMFGTDEVLVAAKVLTSLEGIDVAEDLRTVEYVHFMFDAHQIVFANGAEAESLHTGAEAMKMVGEAARTEIFALFPELADGTPATPARPIAAGHMARRMVERHVRNARPLVN